MTVRQRIAELEQRAGPTEKPLLVLYSEDRRTYTDGAERSYIKLDLPELGVRYNVVTFMLRDPGGQAEGEPCGAT